MSSAQTFAKIALHNKLIDQQKFDECLALHTRTGGELPVEDILLQKGYLSQKQIDAIKKALAAHQEKKSATAAPAAPAPKPVIKSSVPSIAPPKPAAPAPGKNDSGPIPFDDGAAPGKPLAKPPETLLERDDDVEDAEEIEDADEAEETRDMKQENIPPAPPTKAPAPAAAGHGAVPATAKADRIPCDVTPLKLDPMAVKFIKEWVAKGISDVHLASGAPPFTRLHGSLVFSNLPPLTAENAKRIVLGFMTDDQQQHFLRTRDVDFSFEHKELGRFRCNALEQFRGTDLIMRVIPSRVPTLAELGLPETLAKFTEWHQGLVLVTGPAGCGKSTTAAALVDLINTSRKDHVITVEDPVEFLHKSKGCNVTQRQVPSHTASFASALRAALREDPDVILIGEMRDLETVSLAIRAAETGHLVIGTLHTKSAPRTIDRVVDVFPSDQQAQIRTMLSESLRGVISQQLIPTIDGKGRVVALEVLHVSGAVSNLIRDSRSFQLHSLMQTGKKVGQKLMDDSLLELVQAGRISKDEAMKAAENPKQFK